MALTYEPIGSTTLGADGTITFSSIPGTYTDLRLIVRGTNSFSNSNTLNLRINGLNTAVYSSGGFYSSGTTNSLNAGSITNYVVTTENTGSVAALQIIDFINYANTSYWKSGIINVSAVESTTVAAFSSAVFTVQTTSAITTILVAGANVGNLLSGATATLFGIKAA